MVQATTKKKKAFLLSVPILLQKTCHYEMCKVLFAILFSLVATINGDVIDSALQNDDQCDMADAECSFNALQLRGLKEEMELEENNEEGEGWLKDISTKTKNHFKHILAPLQTPIVTNYQYLTVLDSYVNYTMEKVENATGHLVVWNRKSLLQEDSQEDSEEDSEELGEIVNSYGRRRHTGKSEDLPPRARDLAKKTRQDKTSLQGFWKVLFDFFFDLMCRIVDAEALCVCLHVWWLASRGYINKILIYLNKEMDAVWNMNTIVDRKRWGVGGLTDLDSLSCHPSSTFDDFGSTFDAIIQVWLVLWDVP